MNIKQKLHNIIECHLHNEKTIISIYRKNGLKFHLEGGVQIYCTLRINENYKSTKSIFGKWKRKLIFTDKYFECNFYQDYRYFENGIKEFSIKVLEGNLYDTMESRVESIKLLQNKEIEKLKLDFIKKIEC